MLAPTPATQVVTADSAIPQRTILGDETISLGSLVLVASGSTERAWHRVEAGRCTCKGFSYRGHCRHLAAARAAANCDVAAPLAGPHHDRDPFQEVPLRQHAVETGPQPLCRRCQKRPVNPRWSKTRCTLCTASLDPE